MAQTIMELQISMAVFMDSNLSPSRKTGLASLFNVKYIHNSSLLAALGKRCSVTQTIVSLDQPLVRGTSQAGTWFMTNKPNSMLISPLSGIGHSCIVISSDCTKA